MVNVRIEVFNFSTKAERNVLFTARTEVQEPEELDLSALRKVVRILFPKSIGFSVTLS